MKIIDLTHLFSSDTPIYPGTKPPSLKKGNDLEKDGFRETILSFYSHTGTHIDAPAHMLSDGFYLENMPINSFIGRAIILDFSNFCKHLITLSDIINFQEKLTKVNFVILKTGWSNFWMDGKYFNNYPSLNKEAACWLSKFNLNGIGIDAISIDKSDSTTFNIHKLFFAKNMLIIENLTNLDAINVEYFTLAVFPLKFKNSDGSPVRAIAIIDNIK